MQANIHLCSEKAPIYNLSFSKAPKTQQTCGYRHTRKPVDLFNDTARASTILSTLGSFAKVSIPVKINNSLP